MVATRRIGLGGAFVFLLLACLATATPAAAGPFSADVQQLGAPQTVFDKSAQACEGWDIPDAPARAFRDAGGRVQLIASHYITRRELGPTLDNVHHDCRVVLNSTASGNLGAYDDLQWIGAPFTIEGRRVYAALHEEFRGWTHSGQCDSYSMSNDLQRCLMTGVTFARSLDGGETYMKQAAPDNVLAPSPYTYSVGTGPRGLRNPTNIVYRPDGFYYMMIAADKYGDQLYGSCLLRTKTIYKPRSWRAWDGSGFSIRFVNPYEEPSAPAAAHLCVPVSRNQIDIMTASLTYNMYFGKYLLLGVANTVDSTGAPLSGFFYSLSDDLITWSPLKLLQRAELTFSHVCGEEDPVAYPSFLDSTSPNRNFNVTRRSGYLYYTQFHIVYGRNGSCSHGADRDLMRVPIRFSAPGGAYRQPNCNLVTASPSVLSSPTHDFAKVRVAGGGYQIEITGVTQDERPNSPDARWEYTPDEVSVRAEYDAGGDGRVYRIAFTAVGGTGTCKGVAKVTVPERGRDSTTQAFDSFAP